MNIRSKAVFASFLTVLLVLSVVGCASTPAPELDTPTAPTASQATEPVPTATAPREPSATPPPPPPSPTPTHTPTPMVVAPAPTTPAPDTRCAGLTGSIEVQVLVGPAEVVGLEPVAVGSVPFAVASEQAPFVVQGSAPIAYADVLIERWGTYEVTMDLEATVSGECSGEPGGEALNLTVEIAGEQLVVVDAGSFYGEYPWNGTASVPAAFPLQDGATAEGEGWVLVLHLQAP